MRLLQGLRGITKLMLVILLLITFIAGATLSYIWTMGYYASQEYKPSKNPHVTIEDVVFSAQNPTFFDVVILNPSNSPSSVNITQMEILTENGTLQDVEVSPNLPFTLEVGGSETFRGLWNWASYTGQIMKVIVFVAEGSGPTHQVRLPYVGLTVEAHFNSSISIRHFNVTVRNADTSATYVNITELAINGETIPHQSITVNGTFVSFPYFLNSSQSVMFTCAWNWINYQGESVSVTVGTSQGYMAKHSVVTPSRVETLIEVAFNPTISIDQFNVTVKNLGFITSGAYIDINEVFLQVDSETINITEWSPSPARVKAGSAILLVCNWNWQNYRGKTATVTIGTLQGFQFSSEEITIPP